MVNLSLHSSPGPLKKQLTKLKVRTKHKRSSTGTQPSWIRSPTLCLLTSNVRHCSQETRRITVMATGRISFCWWTMDFVFLTITMTHTQWDWRWRWIQMIYLCRTWWIIRVMTLHRRLGWKITNLTHCWWRTLDRLAKLNSFRIKWRQSSEYWWPSQQIFITKGTVFSTTRSYCCSCRPTSRSSVRLKTTRSYWATLRATWRGQLKCLWSTE